MHFSELLKYCPVCGSSSFVQNNEKSKRCERCGFVMYINPSAAVAAFIVNKNNELLVCRRAKEPAKGTLDLPGGFVDDDETAEQALQREIGEELSAEVAGLQYMFSLPNQYLYSGWTIPTLDMFFHCELTDYSAIVPADDVEDCFFVPLSRINPDDFGLKSIKKAVGLFMNQK